MLTLLLFLVGVSGVCATDNNTDSLNPVEDNDLQLNDNADVDVSNVKYCK